MAKAHITLHDPSSYVPWKEFAADWIPDDIDLILEQYDNVEESSSASRFQRVPTNGEGNISSSPKRDLVRPPQLPPVRPQPLRFGQQSIDPQAIRRQAARESFQRQVQGARSHAAGIMAKIGNGK
jgi:hypothetical protein